jgi:peptidoglycan hydrolase-like protein with peptidoglycan-binding domain
MIAAAPPAQPVPAPNTAQVVSSRAAPARAQRRPGRSRGRIPQGSYQIGSRGPAVRVLQDELARLRYEVPISGYFDEATGRAVIAFRKVMGMERVPRVNGYVFRMLADGRGHFHARYPGQGSHVEADLSKQVLVELEPHGRVRRILTMSSGKPSTPSPTGRFAVYSKTPGTNSEGMVDSSYFTGGYAIHGYAEVPTWAASHGCLRIPIPDAAAVYAWVRIGYPVDVYG